MRNCLMCTKYSALRGEKKEFDRRPAFGIQVTKEINTELGGDTMRLWAACREERFLDA